jgi:hypothetical protein
MAEPRRSSAQPRRWGHQCRVDDVGEWALQLKSVGATGWVAFDHRSISYLAAVSRRTADAHRGDRLELPTLQYSDIVAVP